MKKLMSFLVAGSVFFIGSAVAVMGATNNNFFGATLMLTVSIVAAIGTFIACND